MGLSTSNMLHGSMNKFLPFFSEFQCNENNAMKPISSVAIGSTENPWKIKDNTRKGNRALQSPISATITEGVWIIKITFTAQFRWEKQVSVSVHCWFVLAFFFFTCLLYICFTLDKNGPRTTYVVCLIASSQNKKGQVDDLQAAEPPIRLSP